MFALLTGCLHAATDAVGCPDLILCCFCCSFNSKCHFAPTFGLGQLSHFVLIWTQVVAACNMTGCESPGVAGLAVLGDKEPEPPKVVNWLPVIAGGTSVYVTSYAEHARVVCFL